ncbi:pyoverdine/dityrosine biosynthesis protein [Colletotrichum higginsianum]|uniref:Pyoverdine/dityrosine biosynthesis protein n=2 Tax=Colletotrichum higginsianum TaxID=80884 RepID=H1V3Y5_COLHI|nr:Pyoverdine/dityrosine biosynthesis protein [Colletotrichum higginsianum IMI 349063]OBR11951.1 Pyoverdine/dityrosine biosynthesis protein [Colletotrichum higginsianum IMI 349063]TIC98893.1 Spore wall maturation protein DIT1 [Colletotrichum higginsianum]CCF34937.1 pyoverdine/dityrosine biosynthesis protein [Colletotrichum higginsianum]
MEFSNDGNSIFHRFQAAFVHDGQGQLLYCSGPQKGTVHEHWDSISRCLPSQVRTAMGERQQVGSVDLDGALRGSRLYERQRFGACPTGIILNAAAQNSNALSVQFEEFFAELLLDQADFAIRGPELMASPSSESLAATEQIVNLFDSFLRYQGKDDQWEASGRVYFTDRVRHFTSQNARIDFCLPAFPCKSSNTNKVLGKAPDRGEQLALERLHGFVEAIEKIYPPGAKMWIISDGHVFSDCIGVDDADVDTYGEQLKEMNRAVGVSRGNTDRVGFRSLVDLFELNEAKSQHKLSELQSRLDIPNIDHHVETRLTVEAELCRQILMAGCQPQESAVRAQIKSQNAAILALYRGFSRFMLEDLELHPFTQKMTRSQRKKLSTKVAFEMIMRNQSYSNLVELLLPNYVRLSIHAHNNAGPKFGIQLFDPAVVRAVEGLSPDGTPMTSRDLLHIPTPWHNCLVEVQGSPYLLVTKASVPREAVSLGAVTVEISTKNAPCFVLRPKKGGVATVDNREEKKKSAPLLVIEEKPTPALIQSPVQRPKAPKSQGRFDWARRLAAFPVLCWLGVVFYHRVVEAFV